MLKNLSLSKRVVIVDFIVCLVLIFLSCISLLFGEYILIVCMLISSCVSVINSFLLVKSGDSISPEGTSLTFVIFTFLRFLLMIVGIILSTLLIYTTMSSEVNKYRYLMVLIGTIPYFTSTFVLAFVK